MKSADRRTSCHRQLPFVLILSCVYYCEPASATARSLLGLS